MVTMEIQKQTLYLEHILTFFCLAITVLAWHKILHYKQTGSATNDADSWPLNIDPELRTSHLEALADAVEVATIESSITLFPPSSTPPILLHLQSSMLSQ